MMSLLPEYLNTKCEVAVFCVAGKLVDGLNDTCYGDFDFERREDGQSFTLIFWDSMKTSAIQIDENKILISQYMSKFINFSIVIDFRETFGTNITLPIKSDQIVIKEKLHSATPLQYNSYAFAKFFNTEINRRDVGPNLDILGKGERNDWGRPEDVKKSKNREYILNALKMELRLKNKKQTFMKNLFPEECSKSDSEFKNEEYELKDQEYANVVHISNFKPLKVQLPVEYPEIQLNGTSSPLFGLRSRSPFGRFFT
ncbi:hypothetical protein BN7_3704 [Wickerhamomyces ciferrii]|uniref:Uncharacterized protein n=1 Tax=Wickerhamomyces ciferrii (strain ATCC 14091 / BCRC 22168 / CBS 111 / JCM 3599 / NBRC 0793 / NRRL Y-1031 F-60-10) TaxID=1206466 RepID=K0KMD4_WICCF|nr:uncharacterized protein BN7_3704 [Wickerhamomyces ciferrii]CCH44146.1 hypothetical protein BN7_3704 [Wickerhamomyces ciferrii]